MYIYFVFWNFEKLRKKNLKLKEIEFCQLQQRNALNVIVFKISFFLNNVM